PPHRSPAARKIHAVPETPWEAGAGTERTLAAGLASRAGRGAGAVAGVDGGVSNAPQASHRVNPSGRRSPQRGQVMLESVVMPAVYSIPPRSDHLPCRLDARSTALARSSSQPA